MPAVPYSWAVQLTLSHAHCQGRPKGRNKRLWRTKIKFRLGRLQRFLLISRGPQSVPSSGMFKRTPHALRSRLTVWKWGGGGSHMTMSASLLFSSLSSFRPVNNNDNNNKKPNDPKQRLTRLGVLKSHKRHRGAGRTRAAEPLHRRFP
jgi:hypothetical protein